MPGETGGMPDGTFMGLGKKGWGIAGIGAASVLPMLFGGMGGGGDYDNILGNLEKSSNRSFDNAQQLGMDSQELFRSVLPYLQAVTGGDRQALLGATMPERKRVIDQYATARKALGEFGPRSGGTAGALAGMNANQASDLSMIGANARTGGINMAGNLASGLQSQSIASEGAGNNSLGTMANIINARNQQQAQSAGSWGNALGMLLGLAI